MPIKAWTKEGKEIIVEEFASDKEINEGFEEYLNIFAMISQKYKTIVTKVEMEGKDFTITIQQK